MNGDSWKIDGLCARIPDVDFFSEREAAIAAAKAVCARCSAQSACLDAGMAEEYGIWGGTTTAGRRQLRIAHGELVLGGWPEQRGWLRFSSHTARRSRG
jgi:hypothetical protein